MSKLKTTFICQNCGVNSSKWVGKCPSCNEWNTFLEEVVEKKKNSPVTSFSHTAEKNQQPELLQDITSYEDTREKAPGQELNRVLGGGIVPGSMVLIGGEPGIGKSTLMLQTAVRMNRPVFYVSGEESAKQLKMRADRLGIQNEKCYIYAATNLQTILKEAKRVQPELMVIDSIQTISTQHIDSAPGSVSQIRECASELLRFAKTSNIPVFIVGHITKEGQIAGPKILEHMVDTVLNFEGDRHHTYRILRTAKNRFGSTSELGIYEMDSHGLKEVLNPSEMLIGQRDEHFSGVAISAAIEGMRPLLIESQALVSTAVYGTPQRNANGFDIKRLNTILAVLEKRCGFKLGAQDVFINVAGGLKLDDPAMDLGMACAILSSYENLAIPGSVVFFGELGLSGEIRAVPRADQRIKEAAKLGFKTVVLSKFNKNIEIDADIEVKAISKIEEAFEFLFG